MKCSPSLQSLQFLSLSVTLCILSGCATSFTVPDTGADGETPAIQGSVFGGHAPLVGAHVYVFQVGVGAIGAPSISLLGVASGTTSPTGYPLQTNVNDPNIPAGAQYVLTDSTGSFGLSNGYKCTANVPVYIYAYGGAPTVSGPGVFNPAVVNLATLGLCPLSGTFKGTIYYVYMNEVSTVATAYAFQGFTSPANNDAAHIGYSGLVSPSEGLKGIQNAAANTLQLYDIAGSVAGHSANYQTYNPTTSQPNKGFGVVPQTVLDTLANILATCVDSGNSTYPATNANCTVLFNTATSDGSSSGTKPTDTATAAINIARHPAGMGNPGFAATLWGVPPTATFPFSPALTAAPKDFSVAIQYAQNPLYPPGAPANPEFGGARSIATDASGDFWLTTETSVPNPTGSPATFGSGYMVEGSPFGVVLHQSANTTYAMGNVVIDSSQNAWAGTIAGHLANSYEDGPTTGYVLTGYGTGFTAAVSPVADNSATSGDLYFTHGPTCPIPAGSCTGLNNNPELTEVLPNGNVTGGSPSISSSFPAGAFPTHAAIDAAGYEWITSDTPSYGYSITRVAKNTGVPALGFPINAGTFGICGTGFIQPEQPAIDALGNAWIPVYGTNGQGTGVYVVSPLATCAYYDTEFGSSVAPYGAAVDGANNIWITNTTGGSAGSGSLAELSGLTGANLSSANLQPVNQVSGSLFYLLNDPLNVAVDISGDVFVTNYTGNSVVEFIGLATPLYGPLGVAAGGIAGVGKIGVAP